MKVQGQIEFTITEQSAKYVMAEMPITSGIQNPFGTVHAGAILWFADVSATALVLGKLESNTSMAGFPLAISLNAHLLSNQKNGFFIAKSIFVKKGKTISTVRTTVMGSEGKMIAEVTTSHILSK